LGVLQHRPAVPAIIARINDEVLAVGHAAAEALGKIGDPAAVPALIEVLSSLHADWVMCINAAQALGALGDVQAVPAMMDLFRRRWDNIPGLNATPPVRKNVIEALAKLGENAVPHLLTALNDSDVKVRHGAVEVLGHMGEQEK
jgi:HEAT repeat protein